MNRIVLTLRTLMPANSAASGLAPMAYIDRPNGVACSTTPKITARTMKMPADQDRSVFSSGLMPTLV